MSFAGPTRKIYAQVLSQNPQPNPLDSITVMFEFESGLSSMLAAIRSTPFFWRIHIFGSNGSAEAIGKNELVIRLNGKLPQRTVYKPLDSLAAEFDAFSVALTGQASYPVSSNEMLATISAFESIVKAVS